MGIFLFLVPQSQNSSDSQAIVENDIALLSEWQEFYKNIIYTAMIIKNTGLWKLIILLIQHLRTSCHFIQTETIMISYNHRISNVFCFVKKSEQKLHKGKNKLKKMLVYCTLLSMIYGLILHNHPKINTQKQRAVTGRFAKKNGLSIDKYISFQEKPDLSLFNSGDTILCYAWTCLCGKRSFLREFIPYVLKNNIYLYSATSKYCIKPGTNIKAFEYAFALYEDIRFNFLSHKSLEGIQTSIKKGYKPGRQTGSKNKTHVLDGKEKQIIKLYSEGVSMNEIARQMDVSAPTIKKFLVSKH